MEELKWIKALLCFLITIGPVSSCSASSSAMEDLYIKEDTLRKIVEGDAKYASLCERWELNGRQIKEALSSMEKVSSVEWGALCYTLPCAYHAMADFHARHVEVRVNAGGHISFIDQQTDEVTYYISRENLPFFLESCNCCNASEEK